MTRFLLPFFCLVFCSGVGFAVQQKTSPPIPDAQNSEVSPAASPSMYYHVNVDQFKRSQTGKILIQSALKIPFVKEQLAGVPEPLRFLIDADVHSFALYAEMEGEKDVNGLIEIRATISNESLIELIGHGRGYAKVEYRGVGIHHWISDFDQLASNVFGSVPAEEDDQSLFMAMLADDHFLIGFGLAELNRGIDRHLSNQRVMDTSEFESKFGQGNNFLSFRCANTPDLQGDWTAVIREASDGELVCDVSICGRDESQCSTLAMVHSVLGNPKTVAAMLVPQRNEPKNDSGEQGLEQVPDTKPADFQATEGGPEANPEIVHPEGVNIGLMVDSHWPASDSFRETFESFLENCIQSELKEDTLNVKLRFFMGPILSYQAKYSDEEAKIVGRKRVTNYVFNICSSTEKREESIRKTQEIRTARANAKKESEKLRR